MGDALANAPETEGERLLSLCVLKAFHINLFCSQMPKVFSRPSQLQTSANTICWWTEHDILSLHRLWQPVEGRLIFAHKAINSSLLLANVQLRNVDVCLEFLLRVLSCEEQRIQTVTVPYRTNTWGVALLFVPVSCLFLSWVTQFRLSLPPRKEPFRFPSLPRRRTKRRPKTKEARAMQQETLENTNGPFAGTREQAFQGLQQKLQNLEAVVEDMGQYLFDNGLEDHFFPFVLRLSKVSKELSAEMSTVEHYMEFMVWFAFFFTVYRSVTWLSIQWYLHRSRTMYRVPVPWVSFLLCLMR